MPTRAIYRMLDIAAAQPPYNSVALKLFYPALDATTEQERATGVLAADTQHAPFPVMLFFPGVNVESYQYYWLAESLAAQGVVVVVMQWIAQNLPGRISLTPGIDLTRITPETYGTGISATALPALLALLAEVNTQAPLAGLLDLDRLILAGHSAGGMLALMNADARYLPQVKAAIAYCANPLATVTLGGFTNGVIPALPNVPMLMLGATEDGIGTHHNTLFGRPNKTGAETIVATLHEAVPDAADGRRYAIILKGANHYSICYPLDTTAGRTFMDTPETANNAELRQLIQQLMATFIHDHVQTDKRIGGLEQLQSDGHDLIATFARK